MDSQYLLDTHIVIRWLVEPRKLSRDQTRIVGDAMRRREPLAFSAVSLLEIGLLGAGPSPRISNCDLVLDRLEQDPIFRVVPLSMAIARELSAMGDSLRDPADRTIVATARVHDWRC